MSDKEKIKAAVSKLRRKDPRVIAIRNMIALAKAKGTPGDTGKDGLDGIRGADGINGTNGLDGMRGADGLHGAKGLDGSKGEIGAVGPQGDKGEAGMIWRGTYRNDIEYDIGDVVGVSGSAYVCIAATNQAPPVGFGWELLVSRGAQGIRGIKGEDGGGGAAAAGTLTGDTLAFNVISSSLESVGVLEALSVTNPINGSIVGNAATATTAGTVTTAAQPAITSVGTLTAVNTSGVITGTNTTASTSSTTGALKIAGGVGIAKDSFVNGLRVGIGGTGAGLVTSNAAFGKDALTGNTGTATVGIGENAGSGNTGTANCVFIGQDSGVSNTGGSTLGIGTSSMYQNTGSACVGVGTNALFLNSGHHCVAIGYDALFSNNGDHCVAIGYATLAYNGIGNQGVSNTAIGYFAGNVNSTGARSTFIGRDAGVLNTTGSDQVFIGSDAGDICTTGTQNTVLGSQADLAANNDNNSIVIGYNAVGLGSNTTVIGTSSTTAATVYGALSVPSTTASTSSTTGAVIVAGGVGIAKDSFINSQRIGVGLLQDTTNLAVGANALQATIAGGNHNTAIGSGCGQAITSGADNTLLGYAVGSLINTGGYNCSIGTTSLNQNQSGNFNTAMGFGALQNTTASNNTAVGLAALGNITTGALNTAIGREAGCFQADGTTALTTANNSVYLGRDTRGTQSDSNSVVIGYQAIGLGANTTVIGTSSTTSAKVFGTLTLDAGALISSTSATALAIKSAVPAGTGVTPTIQIICPSAAFTLTNGTGAQAVFNTPQDTISVQAATTYMFEGQYLLQTGATSHSTSMSFVLTTATITNITWFVLATAGNGAGSLATAQTTTFYNSSGGGQVIGASTNSHTLIKFEGVLRVNVGGTVVPNIAFSVAPGVTCSTLVGSYLKFYPIGANTIDSVGTAIG